MTWKIRVHAYMTVNPHAIERHQPLSEAHELMRQHGIRHLPVLDSGRLVGLVSQRDLHLLESLPSVDPDQVPVEDAMSADVYVVAPHAILAKTVGEMLERKLGSAVVMQGTEVIGVFTTIDALSALYDCLKGQHPSTHPGL